MKKYIWVLLTAMAFGTMEIALKIGGNAFSTIQLTSLRFLIGGLFLLPFALLDLKKRHARALTEKSGQDCQEKIGENPKKEGFPHPKGSDGRHPGKTNIFQTVIGRREIGYILLLSFVNIVVSMTLFQLSVMTSNATLAAVLISFNPMFTMVFAHFIAGERFTLHKLGVLIVCMSGLILVAAPWNLAEGNSAIGILIGLGASLTFGLYTAISKRCVGRIGGMSLNSFSFLIGGVLLAVTALLLGNPEKCAAGPGGLTSICWMPFHLSDMVQGITRRTLPTLMYVSLVVTGFGYFCFMRAVERVGASAASYAFFVKPVIAMLLAAAILGEPITWNIVTGILLILAGCIYNVSKNTNKSAIK